MKPFCSVSLKAKLIAVEVSFGKALLGGYLQTPAGRWRMPVCVSGHRHALSTVINFPGAILPAAALPLIAGCLSMAGYISLTSLTQISNPMNAIVS